MDRLDIAIVGGGLAAATAAETYRRQGGTGTVAIFTQESDLPVHRPPSRRNTSAAMHH
jgi:thioredoxin reductase